MTWKDAISDYSTFLTLEKGLSENTVSAYIHDISRLAEYCTTNDATPEKVTSRLLSNYVSVLGRGKITARSQARMVSSIRSFFKYLLYDDIIEDNPASFLQSPKLGNHLPTVLTVEEIDAMVERIDPAGASPQRDRAILETLFSCGLRVSEAVNLQLSNIHFDEQYIKVIGKGNKERLVPIGEVALHYLTIYRDGERAAITPQSGEEDSVFLNRFGVRLSRVSMFNLIKTLAALAGINKTISPHTFRHSFASALVNGGADIRMVQDMLGHESITTTEIYTHLDNTFTRDTMLHCHPGYRKMNQTKKE